MVSISAKMGTNVDQVLKAIIDRIPPPKGKREDKLQALVFDSHYDSYKGVIAYVRVFNGALNATDALKVMSNQIGFKPIEVGIFHPGMVPVSKLEAGDVGYIATGLKTVKSAGWAIRSLGNEPLLIYRSMVTNSLNRWFSRVFTQWKAKVITH